MARRLTPSLCLQVPYSCKLGVGRRELRRCLCICVKEFNMERSAQFRDGERVDSSTGTNERLDAVKRGRSRCRRAELRVGRPSVSVSDVGTVAKPLNRPRLDEQQIVVGRIVVAPLKRLRPKPNGCRPLLFKTASKLCASFWAIAMSSHKPQSRKARLWLVEIKTAAGDVVCLNSANDAGAYHPNEHACYADE